MPASQTPSPVAPLAAPEVRGGLHRLLARLADVLGLARAPADIEAQAAPDAAAITMEHVALEALPDPVLLIEGGDPSDLTGRRIAFANAAARRLLRIPSSGTLLVSAIRNPEVLEGIDESLFGSIRSETIFETRGAQEQVWRVRSAPLPNQSGGGDSRLALAHFRDDTDAIRAERTRVDFLANASHELRTPLASLTGFIETLRGHAKNDPEAREQFLRIMSAQAERMSRLIDDLMSLSRIELDEHILPHGSCDLTLTVMDVADTLRPLTSARGVTLALTLPERSVAAVAGDRDQLTQVVQNLIDNALKYSAAGQAVDVEVAAGLSRAEAMEYRSRAGAMAAAEGGRLSLLTPDRGDDDRYILLRVADRGPGMLREHLPRLAERFYRVEGQKSGERLGTGLGLAIVKHIVNRHRGGLVVESAPGEGSTFIAYLPMATRRSR